MCPCVILFKATLIPFQWSSVWNHLEMMKMESHYSDTRWQYNTTRRQKAICFHSTQKKSNHKRKAYDILQSAKHVQQFFFFKKAKNNQGVIETIIKLTQSTQKQHSSVCMQFQRSISENSLVAMDFSGQKSRVIENPSEALSVAVEEGLSWRVSHAQEAFPTREKSQCCQQQKK